MTKPKPKVEKQCVKCGSTYLNSHSKSKFCSHDCYYSYSCLGERLKKNCVVCGQEFYSTNTRQIICSHECRLSRKKFKDSLRPKKDKVETYRNCVQCNKEFLSIASTNIYCSKECVYENNLAKRRLAKITLVCGICNKEFLSAKKNKKHCGSEKCSRSHHLKTTYSRLNNNWDLYLSSLCRKRNDPRLQKHFNVEFLKQLLAKQNYKCAISGETLTCIAEINTDPSLTRRVHTTNASIDRINAGKPYTEDNVQLVCYAVNIARSNLKIDEFIDWCARVAIHNKKAVFL